MTIAEKRANEYYPELNEQDDVAAWHGFIAGYEQAKKDMLEEAVEGVVMDFSSNQPRPQVDVYVDPNKYCTGDKVRIIVLKNTEK